MTQEEINAILEEDSCCTKKASNNECCSEEDVFDIIKDIDSAIKYLDRKKLCNDLLIEYRRTPFNSYSRKLAAYRIVVAALTSNEKRYLTIGDRWFPVIQFCKPGKEINCWGSKVIGTIESDGEKYIVVGGYANNGAGAGLSYFDSNYGVSHSDAPIGFRSVSSKRVAKHISEYFGHLLFDIHYGGTNCDWKWIS